MFSVSTPISRPYHRCRATESSLDTDATKEENLWLKSLKAQPRKAAWTSPGEGAVPPSKANHLPSQKGYLTHERLTRPQGPPVPHTGS